MLKCGQQVFVSGDWAVKTGISDEDNEIWQPGWSLNIEAFDAYRPARYEGLGWAADLACRDPR